LDYSKEELEEGRLVARRVLTDLDNKVIDTSVILARLDKRYPIPPTEMYEDMLYADTTNFQTQERLSGFIGAYIAYREEFNCSTPLDYLDIYLGLSDKPMVHYTELFDDTEEMEADLGATNPDWSAALSSSLLSKSSGGVPVSNVEEPHMAIPFLPDGIAVGGRTTRRTIRNRTTRKGIGKRRRSF
jgi:hypothetical protein